ncbi:unnamed protein product [Closterium sp. NIES-53]
MASWRSTGTYVDAVFPPGANVVDGMWIFKVKRPPGSPLVFKARTLLEVLVSQDYELHSLDFSTPFLQGRLHEEFWLRFPPAFTGTFPPGTQWSLRRPVYGLRQVAREWHDTLHTTLAALGFRPSSADPSLFALFFVLVYVNNLVFATADRAALAEVKSELQKRFTCTDLGELRCYLGLQITTDRAACIITLSQLHMVQQVLQRFGLQFSTDSPAIFSTSHLNLVVPTHSLWATSCAMRVGKYMATTSGVWLVIGGTQLVVLTGHCDSSYADGVETQRSTQGNCFSLGVGAVSWRSTRSLYVAQSSAKA